MFGVYKMWYSTWDRIKNSYLYYCGKAVRVFGPKTKNIYIIRSKCYQSRSSTQYYGVCIFSLVTANNKPSKKPGIYEFPSQFHVLEWLWFLSLIYRWVGFEEMVLTIIKLFLFPFFFSLQCLQCLAWTKYDPLPLPLMLSSIFYVSYSNP